MKTHEKYITEIMNKTNPNMQIFADRMNDVYVEWGGEIVGLTDYIEKGNNVAKVQGLLAKADKAYEQFKKFMRDAEKLALKG